MERWICAVLGAALLSLLPACGGSGPAPDPVPGDAPSLTAAPAPTEDPVLVEDPIPETAPDRDRVDVDLTTMSATMVYAEVYDMLDMPGRYLGKTVRMRGACNSAYYEETDTTYYTIIISDATACCAQGMEYLLREGVYPEDGVEATVTGEFETYKEDGVLYCRLKDAAVEI